MRLTHLLAASTLTIAIAAIAPGCADDGKSGPKTGSASGDQPITIAFTRTMHSDILDEDRTLYIYLPSGYDPSQSVKYPLFFYLDARVNVRATAVIIH